MKGHKEVIWDNYLSCCCFMCAAVFSSFCVCQNLCSFVLSLGCSQPGWAAYLLLFSSVAQSVATLLPSSHSPCLCHSTGCSDKCAGRKVTLAKLPGWNPGLIQVGGKIPIDLSVARVSPFSFEVFSASVSQHFCKLCFAPGSLTASEIRAERMVSQDHGPGKEFLGCQVLH